MAATETAPALRPDDMPWWMRQEIGPRATGGRYLCGYWQQEYTVTAVTWTEHTWTMRAQWADGHETTHCTPWDEKRDTIVAAPPLTVTKVWRTASGAQDAVELTAPDGARFSVSMARRDLRWSNAWGRTAAYGFEPYYCPGHGPSGICAYGACDEIRLPAPAMPAIPPGM